MGYRKTLARHAPVWLRAWAVRRRVSSARWLEARLWNGFSRSALALLEERAVDEGARAGARRRARNALARWSFLVGDSGGLNRLPRSSRLLARASSARVVAKLRAHPATGVQIGGAREFAPRTTTHFDVVMMSNFSLPGGTTSSNVQEIVAQSRAGLRTALVHHPVWDWDVSRGVTPAIASLVDGEAVRFIESRDHVTCDLLVIRAPKIGEHLMDDMPMIDAKTTVAIMNQTPMYYYGATGGRGVAYDFAVSAANIARHFGAVRWFPIGPSVRKVLVAHHLAELESIDLADHDWTNIIDAGAWAREGRREGDGVVRVGRHSRDDVVKWPENRELLAEIYPTDREYEIRVLGGASVPQAVLGALPANWRVFPFDGRPVREFLHDLDVYVYFTASSYVEAFGRAPLEALAVGLPVIVPRVFEELFGDAAIYAEPGDVKREIDLLMADDESYERQVRKARGFVGRRFGHEAHVARLAKLGVRG